MIVQDVFPQQENSYVLLVLSCHLYNLEYQFCGFQIIIIISETQNFILNATVN